MFFLGNIFNNKFLTHLSVNFTNSFSEIISERRFISFSAIWGQFLLRMHRNGNKTTSGLKFYARFEFSMPDFLYCGKFRKLDHDFRYF